MVERESTMAALDIEALSLIAPIRSLKDLTFPIAGKSRKTRRKTKKKFAAGKTLYLGFENLSF